MFKTINGWTKETMKAQVRKRNDGSKSCYGDSCRYRGEGRLANGLLTNACAVGCFIPDKMYDGEMERGALLDLLENFPQLEPLMPLEVGGLRKLQAVHDGAMRVPKGGDMRDVICNWIDSNILD